MSDDAIVILREDHRELRRDLRAFARTGEVNTARRGELRDNVVRLWSRHLDADNHALYPEIRERVPDLVHETQVGDEWNTMIERLVTDLQHLEPYDDLVAAKMQVLVELTERHVDHDEEQLFPRARAALGRNALQRLGRQIRTDREHDEREPQDPISTLVRSIRH